MNLSIHRIAHYVMVLIGLLILSTAMAVGPFEFPEVTREAKPWTRWWWLGSAVDEENLTRSLEEFAEVGLGGVEITPIYGIQGQEDRHIDYLSEDWKAMLAYTTREAARLDLGVDMPTGTGWPFGGPSVPLEESDIKVTLVTVELKAAGDSLGIPEDGVLLSLIAYGEEGAIHDLTASVEDGVLTQLPPGAATYYVAYYRFSGRKVKRPAPGGAGRTVNTYSTPALGAYLAHFSEAMADYDGLPLRAHFHDSFEYSGDWAPDLWENFEAQHGYDLRHHLPEMTGKGEPDQIARIKSDYRETLATQVLAAFTQQWTDWTHKHGMLTRNQAHGSPGNLIDLYATVDIPETEIFGPSGFPIPGLRKDESFDNEPPDLLMLKFASSAAHLTGKRKVSSETCTWLGEHFQVALSQAKPEVDQLLAAGINHMFYHGTPYSPDDAAWPGWLFYASVHFGPTNTWWNDFEELNGYIGRSQALLQGSAPANDVLLYFPLHDVWHDAKGLPKLLSVHNIDDWLIDTPFYETAEALTEGGYAFDYVSDALLNTANVSEKGILLGENTYRVIVVPQTPRIPDTTLERLFTMARFGAPIVFLGPVPRDVPGYGGLKKRRDRMEGLTRVWEGHVSASGGAPAVPMGRGKVFANYPLLAALNDVGIVPETLATSGLSMIRRKHDEGYLYFLSNLTAEPIDAYWDLATPAQRVVWLDALHQRSGLADLEHGAEGQTKVRIALKPGESCFLRTYTERNVEGPAWPYWKQHGEAVPVAGPWQVTFTEGGPVVPAAYTLDALASWTEAPDPEVKRFGGTARYETTFDAPKAEAAAWRLSLGTVCESARVTLNGEDLGTAWAFPFALHIDRALKPTGNTLSVEVTNLAANRIADMDRRNVEWKIFHDTNIVNIQYKPFDASKWPLMDSGLLGPVELVPLTDEKL